MWGYIRSLFGFFGRTEETRLAKRLADYAIAISLAALFEEGLAAEVIDAARAGRDIDDNAVGDVEWNAERQFFLVTLSADVCLRKGIEAVETVYSIVAYVLHTALNMPRENLGPFIEACWSQIAIFKNAAEGEAPPAEGQIRFAYDSALTAAQNLLDMESGDNVVPPKEDIANFVTMGPRAETAGPE